MRLAIVADDLTGAMDTGLQLSKRGVRVLVPLSWRNLPQAEALAINTETRAAKASEAYRLVKRVTRLLTGYTLYKKIDSTFRGNIGFELRALAEVLRPRGIVVAPAFPGGGRTTLHGYQRVDGRPLEQTSFARDPRWPMQESYLPTLLMRQAGKEVGLVDIRTVEKGPEAIAEAVLACRAFAVVVDALEDVHLQMIARALRLLGNGWVPCGSAGLAQAWVEAWGFVGSGHLTCPRFSEGPVLIISASRNIRTLEQLSVLRKKGVPIVQLDSWGCYEEDGEVLRLVSKSLAALQRGQDLVLTSSFSPLLPGGQELIVRVLARVAKEIISQCMLGGMCLTGGDAAMAVCQTLEVQALEITGEVQSGIPGGIALGGCVDGLPIVTKAGGFGDERALLEALCYLKGRRNSAAR
ncbi:MAG: four-carbon acid sugar kinase family protein [Anaerolineae bacterium]|nr:four-carbon acid sugar kinase family protein [Anaerolineae bacterium]